MSTDALLQPYLLKHLVFRNRLMSTAHEPAYTEDGMPKERYRLYHAEKAKGGIALTMFGGSSVVSPDCPATFGQLDVSDDRGSLFVAFEKGPTQPRSVITNVPKQDEAT